MSRFCTETRWCRLIRSTGGLTRFPSGFGKRSGRGNTISVLIVRDILAHRAGHVRQSGAVLVDKRKHSLTAPRSADDAYATARPGR